jgi:CheY-like chemotaxis protein
MEKKRILVVDDEAHITRTLKLYLEGTGDYEVRTENLGSRVLAAAREFRPHLIFLDIVMPDADGASIAADIKADEALKDTPIVFLTALVSKREVGREGSIIGGLPFLAKPVEPDAVIKCIQKHLKS